MLKLLAISFCGQKKMSLKSDLGLKARDLQSAGSLLALSKSFVSTFACDFPVKVPLHCEIYVCVLKAVKAYLVLLKRNMRTSDEQ